MISLQGQGFAEFQEGISPVEGVGSREAPTISSKASRLSSPPLRVQQPTPKARNITAGIEPNTKSFCSKLLVAAKFALLYHSSASPPQWGFIRRNVEFWDYGCTTGQF